ncbi:MAG: hypothetical protein LBJ94_01245 [Puniceicoccales bacterium]|nr:hypothetical protein [Puniceicoccales bacterium]
MDSLTAISPTAAKNDALTFDVTPSNTSTQQSSIVPAISTLAIPGAVPMAKSLTERIAHAISGKSPSLELTGSEIEHKEILEEVVETLRKVQQTLQRLPGIPKRSPQKSIDQWWNQAVGPDLRHLIDSMKKLNLREQAAVCEAQASLLICVTTSVTEITGEFLDIIGGLPKGEQAKMLTMKNDSGDTLSMLVAEHAKKNNKATEKLLTMIKGLPKNVQEEILTMKNNAGETLPMFIASCAGLGERVAVGFLMDIIEELPKHVQVEMFTAEIQTEASESCKRTFPILVTRFLKTNKIDIGRFLGVIEGLPKDEQAKIFMTQGTLGMGALGRGAPPKGSPPYGTFGTFPTFVLENAPKAAQRLLAIIKGQDEKTFKAICATHGDRLRFARHVFGTYDKNAIEMFLDMLDCIDKGALAEILKMQNYGNWNPSLMDMTNVNTLLLDMVDILVRKGVFFPMITQRLFPMVRSLPKDEQIKILAIKNISGQTFLMTAAVYASVNDASRGIWEFLCEIRKFDKDVQSEIFMAQSNGRGNNLENIFPTNLPMFMANFILVNDAPMRTIEELMATEELLDVIYDLDKDTQAKIFTAEDNALPMFIAYRAPEVTGRLLRGIRGLGKNVQTKILTAKDNAFSMLVVASNLHKYAPEGIEKFLDIVSGLDKNDQAKILAMQDSEGNTLPMLMVKCAAPRVIEKLLDVINGLKGHNGGVTLVRKMLMAMNSYRDTLPMLVVQYAPESAGKLLDMINDLVQNKSAQDEAVLTSIFTSYGQSSITLPMLVVQHAPESAGKLLDMISLLPESVRVKVFTMWNNCSGYTLPMLVTKHAPGDVEKLLDMINPLPKDALARIFRDQSVGKHTLPMLMTQYAPKATGKLLGKAKELDKNTQVEIFTAQDSDVNTLPILVAKHVPGATKGLLASLEDLEKHAKVEQGKAVTAARERMAAGRETAIVARIVIAKAGRQKAEIEAAVRRLKGK